MPRRSNPTARQARLGAELRKLRERAGIPAGQAARVADMKQGDLSHLEAGRRAVSGERVRALAAQYGVTDTALVDALAAMTGRQKRGWWEQYRSTVGAALLDLAELEHHARSIKLFQMVHVPGLFQTEEHSRALFANAPYEVSRELSDTLSDFRQARRQILDREDPPEIRMVVHEAALRIKAGDRKVARGQLELLLRESHRPAVNLQVIPFARERFSAAFSMLYVEGPVRQLDTAQFDVVNGSIFVDDERQLCGYREVFSTLEATALSASESRDLIDRIVQEL
ncbi:helix-turn-helix transcriptional regulator [Streptomyces sp. XD-27]|uniref:helix-turn-helix domain-containing protein n=1 Tax=Streptomyces sp. XD-27 TaxID=3062779 RepID=UPI0026F4585F|nr:helix-turn-helix transcriptional regulator [Streptomyces sp. XD-27]WKX74308.1 helix-turn-helix transcriptional regulator [Streptomyces sp. XD-27]